MKIPLTILIILTLSMSIAIASQEILLPISEFKMESSGLEDSGSIIVKGIKGANGNLNKVIVNAFDKTFEVSIEALESLPIKLEPTNGIQLSYKKNSSHPGGRTLYVKFLTTDGSEIKNAFMLIVSEDGNQEIYIRTP